MKTISSRKVNFVLQKVLFITIFNILCFSVPCLNAALISDGLTGYWKFNEGSGTTAQDSSGNNNTGTLRNGTVWSAGREGTAVSFDGVDDSLDVGVGNFQLNATNALSISLWFNAGDVTKSEQNIIARGAYWYPFSISLLTNQIRVGVRTNTGGGSLTSSASSTIAANQWYYMVMTYVNGTLSLYLNGEFNNSSTITGTSLEIGWGAEHTAIGSTFFGALDEVRIYNRALSASEVQTIYNGTEFGLDTEPPSAPENLVVTSSTSVSIGLSWSVPTDNFWVTGYEVYRDGIFVSSSTTNSFMDKGLTPNTQYTYTVVAYDGAGNKSNPSQGLITRTKIAYMLTINSTNGYVIKNPSSGNNQYDAGTNVILTAVPSAGYWFSSWSGGVIGTENPATTTMDSNKTITANFTALTYPPLVQAATYYVDAANPLASDGNSGSDASPWKTIQKAANSVGIGDTVLVKAGDYNERVMINRGGQGGQKVIFKAYTRRAAKVLKGFDVGANHVRIEGFDISAEHGGWEGSAIWLHANKVDIVDNYFHVSESAISGIIAISASWVGYWSDIYVANNYIYGCNIGIVANGFRWLVENNEIERLIMPAVGGGDADYTRFFGDNITFRGNYFHETMESEIGDSHTDGFQTFPNNGEIATNITIEKNIVKGFYHQFAMMEGLHGSHDNINIRNNVILDADAWGICAHGITNMHVENNTFFNVSDGIGFRVSKDGSTNSSGWVKNNIFYKCPASYWKEPDCQISGDYNLTYLSGDPAVPSQTNILNRDPLFVNVTNPLGPDGIAFTADDGFHLQSGSLALTGGEGGREIGAYGNISGNSVALKQKVASAFQLYQNYPNPFNSTTNIQFCVPTNGHVRVYVFNIFGQVLTIPFEGKVKAGYQSVQIDGTNLKSGIYFYSLKFGAQRITKRMVLIK